MDSPGTVRHALASTTPWLAPDFLPPNPDPERWGVYWGGRVEAMDLASIQNLIRQEPHRLDKGVEGPKYPVVLVAAPGHPRLRPAAECPELQPYLADRDLRALRASRKRNGWGFYLLLAVCLGMLVAGLGRSVFLPALYAVIYGGGHLEAWATLHQLDHHPEAYYRSLGLQARLQYWQALGGKQARMRSWTLAGAWVAIFLLQFWAETSRGHGADIKAAALVKPLVAAEPWRLLTGPMMHGSPIHILMNAMATLSLAPLVERSVHRHLVIPVWLLAALGGALASWWLLPDATSVGASGGLMGLLGFLAVMGWRRRKLLPVSFTGSLFRSILVMVVFGLLAWQLLDNAGHGGGLVVGGLLGAWIFRGEEETLPLEDSPALAALGWSSLALFLLLTLFTAAKLLAL